MTTTDADGLARDLDAHLYDLDAIEWEGSPEPPPDAEHADRLLGARARIIADAAAVSALAAKRRAALDVWEAEQLARLLPRVEWIGSALEQYHRALIARDPKRATVALPNGTLKSTKVSGGAEWEWTDDDAAAEYLAEQAPDLVSTPDPTPPKQRPDKKAIKAATVVVDDVPAAVVARREYLTDGPHEHDDPDAPPRFVAGTGVEGEQVPVIDLDVGAPVPGLVLRRVARRYVIA